MAFLSQAARTLQTSVIFIPSLQAFSAAEACHYRRLWAELVLSGHPQVLVWVWLWGAGFIYPYAPHLVLGVLSLNPARLAFGV